MTINVVHTTVSNSTSVTIPSTTAGNTLVVCVMGATGSGAPSVSGVTLGGSSTGWSSAKTETGASNEAFAAQWINQNIAGGQTAVVISGSNLDVASGFGGVAVLEISGCVTSGGIDKSNASTGTSTSWSSGATGTLTQASEIAIGCCNASAGSVAGPSSPWTNISPTGGFAIAGYQVVSATTSLTYAGTNGSNPFPWATTIITLEASGTLNVNLPVAQVNVAAFPLLPPVNVNLPVAQVNVAGHPVTPASFLGVTLPAAQVEVTAYPLTVGFPPALIISICPMSTVDPVEGADCPQGVTCYADAQTGKYAQLNAAELNFQFVNTQFAPSAISSTQEGAIGISSGQITSADVQGDIGIGSQQAIGITNGIIDLGAGQVLVPFSFLQMNLSPVPSTLAELIALLQTGGIVEP